MKEEEESTTKLWVRALLSTDSCLFLMPPLVIMWIVLLVNLFMSGDLNRYGIVPRTTDGLVALLYYPFIHATFGHLIGNSCAFYSLGSSVLLIARSKWVFAILTVAIVDVSGIFVWIFGGEGTSHVGCSGIIYGWFGYLITLALLRRDVCTCTIALLCALIYASAMLSGLEGTLPLNDSSDNISYEGHFFGLAVGIGFVPLELFLVSVMMEEDRYKKEDEEIDEAATTTLLP